MIFLFMFGPTDFNRALVQLCPASDQWLRQVNVNVSDEDPTLYQAMYQAIIETSPTKEMIDSQEVFSSADQIIIFTPQLGDRFSTIALSMPHPAIHVITGVNIGMLCSLSELSEALQRLIVKRTQDDEEVISLSRAYVDEGLREDWAAITLCELLSGRGQEGVIFLNGYLRDADDESALDLSMFEGDHGSF